jgi:Na+/H+ antiporter
VIEVAEVLVGLFAAAVALTWLARRVDIPYPIVLVLGGAAIALVPGLPPLPLDPEGILVIVLPPILYQAALTTSWRDFRANLRAISLLAVGLVIATMLAVAGTLKLLVPELPWAAAFALGAIVSPPDAVAATAIMSRTNMPRRIATILEGESLVNDASGLVLYKFAVAAALTGTFSLIEATGEFTLVAAGGIAVGFVLGRLFVAIHRGLGDPFIEILLSLVLPYAAYLAAESVNASGVLAVVTAGLVRGQHAPEAFSPRTRLLAMSVWNIAVFVLNCFIFIVIGLQLPGHVEALKTDSLGTAIGYGLALSLVAIGVRMLWVFVAAYLPGWVLRRLGRAEPVPPWQHVTVIGWSGMRGIVSLAAALALPLATGTGPGFPHRELLVFLAFIVIFVTLVLPGLTLAPLARALGVCGDWGLHEEKNLARTKLADVALEEIERLEQERDVTPEVAASLRNEYTTRRAHAAPTAVALEDNADPWRRSRLALVRAERRALIALWHAGQIGDEVMHEIELELDLEESLLA